MGCGLPRTWNCSGLILGLGKEPASSAGQQRLTCNLGSCIPDFLRGDPWTLAFGLQCCPLPTRETPEGSESSWAGEATGPSKCSGQMLGSGHLPGPALHSLPVGHPGGRPFFHQHTASQGAAGSLAFTVPVQGTGRLKGAGTWERQSWHTARCLVGPCWLLASTGGVLTGAPGTSSTQHCQPEST